MQDILEAVKNELKIKLNKNKIDDYEEISIDLACEILESEGLPVYTDFKNNLISPWAIARYIQLSLEEKELIEKVKSDLNKFIPNNIEIAFLKKFSCAVQLSKSFVEGEKQQAITLKYVTDDDDNIQYKIMSTGTWCWDITKPQLEALLKNEIIISENNQNKWKIEKKKKSLIKRIFKL